MKKVLIFGAAGFVGSYLAEEFTYNGYEVIGSDKKETLFIPFMYADILNVGSVERVIKEIAPDIIVNLAAISSVGQSWNNPQMTISVNVIGALNILEIAKRLEKVPKILLVGSSEEYEISNKPVSEKTPLNANNPYGISKVAQERFAEVYRERFGMKIYYVRPFNHTGVGQSENFVLPSFCKQVAEIEKAGKPGVIKVGNLDVKRDFSDVRDIVRAYRMIVESEDCTKIYNVGSGKAYSLRELLKYVISLSNQIIDIVVDLKKFRPMDTRTICCDNSKIKFELGWEPKYEIWHTLNELYVRYRDSGVIK